MNPRQVTAATSALPRHPEKPFKYVEPVTAQDGSVGYDHPLENYFDASMASRLLPSKTPTKLYDTIARAHDHRFQDIPNIVDPSWSTPRPLILNPPERRRSLARIHGNPPDYMGISSDQPEWRPRRSSYEDRRGAVGVTPSEVNTLVPHIPPIDTSMPPPSQEWLDAMAKRILADAHADFEQSHPTSTTESGSCQTSNDNEFFNYDTDSSLDRRVAVPRASVSQPVQQIPQEEPESNPYDYDFSSTDTETDVESDGGYNWSTTRISESSPHALADVPRWIIPRRRPSYMIVDGVIRELNNSNDVSRGTGLSSHQDDPFSPLSSEDEQPGKRRRGRKTRSSRRLAKKPKRHANDMPARRGGKSIGIHNLSDSEKDSSPECSTLRPLPRTSSFRNVTPAPSLPPVSSITTTVLKMKHVHIESPRAVSPPVSPDPHSTSVPPKSPKLFPCFLNGCNQVCASAGDLQRHQQSLRHCVPSHNCLACGKSYTRSDALKRHLNSKASCKRGHATKLTNDAEKEEVLAEAN